MQEQGIPDDDDDDDDDEDMEEEEFEEDCDIDVDSDSDEMREVWPECDMCGIAGEETRDFKDGHGWVCIECRAVILRSRGEPDPEADPSAETEPEADPGPDKDNENGPDTKRRRV
jgi:hypothetical protein